MRLPRSLPRSGIAAGAVLAVLLAVVLVAVTRGGPAPVDTESVHVGGTREADGRPVILDGTIYLPAGSGRHAAVLLAHGYGGSAASVAPQARDLARHGYVALAYSARGFGYSGGKIHLDSPDYEVKDAQRMLDYLARRPEVRMDGANDPRVAVVGASYGGGLALLLAGTDPRVDAVVPDITWHDLRQALFPQFAVTGQQRTPAEVTPIATPGVFKKQWAAVFLGGTLAAGQQAAAGSPPVAGTQADGPPTASPTPGGTGPGLTARQKFGLQALAGACGSLATDVCLGYAQAASTGRPTAKLLDLLYRSSPASLDGRITAPTLLLQGEYDSLFPLSEADANARAIAGNGTPVSVVWTSGGHDGGQPESAREWTLTDRFLDQTLSAPGRFTGRIAGPGMRVTVPNATVSSTDSNPAPQHRERADAPGQRPGSAPVAVTRLPLSGPQQLALSPPGAAPAALSSLPGFGAALGLLGSAGSATSLGSLSTLPGQTATFTTAPLRKPMTVIGAPRVRVHVTSTASDATLFASLLDVSPDGSASLPQQLVTPVRLEKLPAAGATVTIALPALVHDVPAGHRLRVALSSTDQAYSLPQDARGYRISLAGDGGLSVPRVPLTVEQDGGSNASLLPAALGLLAALALALIVGLVRRRRLGAVDRARDDDAPPLRITGLGKAYGDGFRAVTDLSFDVEAGRVLGLLGPNGAGKTTTLRMLMGLITPSEGEIRVFGHRVRAGAPVLSRVGAFVEGPGFLPHLSGLDNLQLYWRSTGRPDADARFDVALEVAGLGEDLQRKVRTYSHGMRQRLAIAQAMLGLPELLVLDEPTNGLDPPQIREMREVLQHYAATGRTVLVSSHLLAEVEQTCSHVVVMARGRLVAQGPVAELVGQAGTLLLDVDDPATAARVAAAVDGVGGVSANGAGLVVQAAPAARAPLVRALVEAGVAVERVAPQRGLEETFLTLVGGDDDA